MKISFHGAAGTVTGSKHVLTLADGRTILLDCGLFQGLGRDTDDLNAEFGFDPASLDALVLSHAHIDHTGLIPKLVKDGFRGPIFCTPATRDLTDILLHDSAEIQTYETDHINRRRARQGKPPYEPLYGPEDVTHAMELFRTFEYGEWFCAARNVMACFTDAGHLIGSAAVTLKIEEEGETVRVLFSGDVGRQQSVLLCPPEPPAQVDYIILESTYGDKHHNVRFNNIETLHEWVQKVCVERGGQLVIPAFSVGRTQEVLYALNQLSLEKRLPDIPFFVDSPLSLKATQTIKQYSQLFNERLQKVLAIDDDPFEFPGLNYVETVDESRQLVNYDGPCVIISASGTADAGRVRHHINKILSEPKNAVLMVGYCSPRSLGGHLLAGEKEVEIFSDSVEVKAEIGQLPGMSAHGDCDDLCRFVSAQEPSAVRGVFLVHGEGDSRKALAAKLEAKGFKNIVCPAHHQEADLSPADRGSAAAA